MKKVKIVLCTLIFCILPISQASAALISGLSGPIQEGNAVVMPPGITPTIVLGDLGPNPSDTMLGFIDDASIYGRVVAPFEDAFTVVGNGIYSIIFSGLNGSADWEIGVDLAGATMFSGVLNSTTGDLTFSGLMGNVSVLLGGINGVAQYRVDIVQASTPATLGLIGLGLAGLFLRKSRQKQVV